jgi:hypothetical protein
MYRATAIFVLSLAWAGQIFAGALYPEEIVCPVGGEKFTVYRFAACAVQPRMSVYQITTCEPFDELPVCPSNGLPLYRDFSAAEVERLTGFVETAEYGDLSGKSVYLRAHAVEEFLVGEGSVEAFWLLHSALCGNAEMSQTEPDLVDLYVREADREKDRASAEDRPYLMVATAHQLALVGRDDEAKTWLENAREAAEAAEYKGQHLYGYIETVTRCVGKADAAECQPGPQIVQ